MLLDKSDTLRAPFDDQAMMGKFAHHLSQPQPCFRARRGEAHEGQMPRKQGCTEIGTRKLLKTKYFPIECIMSPLRVKVI